MKIFIKLILVLFVFFNITLPLGVLAADTPGEKVGEAIGMDSLGFTANVAIGDFKDCDFGSGGENNCLGKYIQAWYGFAVGIVGILATFMIMYAGFKYLTSRGDGKAINDAKDIMISGISGIVIAFLSYTVLNLVNPQLLIIHMPSLPSIQDTSGTDLSKQEANTGENDGTSSSSGTVNPASPQDIVGSVSRENLTGRKEFVERANKLLDQLQQEGKLPPGARITSGYRQGDDGQHGAGNAFDVTWSGITRENAQALVNEIQRIDPGLSTIVERDGDTRWDSHWPTTGWGVHIDARGGTPFHGSS